MTAASELTAQRVVDGVDLTGRTCVITGASSGLGREAARVLAAAGAHVVLAARNAAAIDETITWIRGTAPSARLSAVSLDLTSLSAVRAAAAEIAALAPELHVLMNNAGVMFTPFGRTADGFEMQFGTNHLGHFALTQLLLPQLAADGSRVVNLSSDGHLMSDVDLDDPNWQHRDYDKFLAYGASKTANVLHAVELDRRYRDRGIRSYAVHPGIVATALARHMTRDDFASLQSVATISGGRPANVDVRRDFVGPERGAATQVWAAVSPKLADTGGVYLADCAVRSDVAPYAIDPEHAARLWSVSEELCGLTS
ncbi:MAG TPA: SDR family NAD(P)-dependent oxidoreductase [Mycobacterium sp.]